MVACAASGADQLRKERLRYVAAAELEAAHDQSGDCWDLSSEEDAPSPRPTRVPVFSNSEALAASGAGLAAEVDRQPMRCHHHSQQHAMLTAAVKQMLQQDGMVRRCKRQSLTGLLLAYAYCGV